MNKQLEEIIYEKKDLVARVVINRPQHHNAITVRLLEELCLAFETAEADPGVGVVVLTGIGEKEFCPGMDLDWARSLLSDNVQNVYNLSSRFFRLMYNMRHCGKPVIARLNGLTAGGGTEMLIHSDLAVAAERVKIQAGEGGIGAIASAATQSLWPIIGDKRARWFLFTDAVIDAQTAWQWGLVNKVVPYAELDKTVDDLCQVLLSKGRSSLRFTKTQTNVWHALVSQTYDEGADYWALQSTLPEMHEGVKAFLNRRPPPFIKMRQDAAAAESVEYFWGLPSKSCPKCNAENLGEKFVFCPICGERLKEV